MNNNYKNHEQLNVIEDKQSLLYLLKQRDTYHLLILRRMVHPIPMKAAENLIHLLAI